MSAQNKYMGTTDSRKCWRDNSTYTREKTLLSRYRSPLREDKFHDGGNGRDDFSSRLIKKRRERFTLSKVLSKGLQLPPREDTSRFESHRRFFGRRAYNCASYRVTWRVIAFSRFVTRGALRAEITSRSMSF